MEVVMGIKPQLPATVQSRLPVEEIGATEYVRALLDYLEGKKPHALNRLVARE